MNYFDKIPTITYDGKLCKNLLARARLSDETRKNQSIFYPYTMSEADRIDILSNDYYEDPGYTWLIWMTNNVVDPYFDLPLNTDDFNNMISVKYGSYATAARNIKFYRNNWSDNTHVTISITEFNNLNPPFKKYYQPVVDNDLKTTGYIRKRYDDVVTTNQIITLAVINSDGFIVGEEINVDSENYGFITHIDGNNITVNSTTGTFATSNAVTGITSNSSTVISEVNIIHQTIAFTEALYWHPVSFLEYEQDLNEQKKAIYLLDPRYISQADNDLRRVMSL